MDRLLLLTFYVGNIIFQIVLLLRSKITVRNCVLILSTTCPLIIISLRYICFILFFPKIKYLFHHMCMEENIIQDSIEAQIRTKYISDSRHMIEILLWMAYATITLYSILGLCPIIFIILLNESPIRMLHYVTLLSVNGTIYFYILCLDFLFIIIFGLLSMICTETIVGIYIYHTSILFKIISHRIQKIIAYLNMFNLLSNQIESKLAELYCVVDIHNQAIQLLVNAITIKKDQLEILISLIIFVNHLVIMFLCNHTAQILINNNEEFFHELYISVWYSVPLKVQKILLLIMIRSSMACIFHICGVFVPCHAGFTTMLSTSFSYFTLMYSIQ
ncbi:hypothetical protein HZU67_09541 [Apis mellifera carnica]|nr:hypothetical protein HZU67_09541 [Apis mellifera carnica]